MSLSQQATIELNAAHEFFTRSTRNLTDDHSAITPAEGMMTAAQQMAHAAQTIEWFMTGAFRAEGFDTNWEEHSRAIKACESMSDARAWFDKAVAAAKALVGSKSDEEWMVPLPPGPIMGGAPRFAIISAITDHTAHHRGALTVYARLAGVVPPMPYMET